MWEEDEDMSRDHMVGIGIISLSSLVWSLYCKLGTCQDFGSAYETISMDLDWVDNE